MFASTVGSARIRVIRPVASSQLNHSLPSWLLCLLHPRQDVLGNPNVHTRQRLLLDYMLPGLIEYQYKPSRTNCFDRMAEGTPDAYLIRP